MAITLVCKEGSYIAVYVDGKKKFSKPEAPTAEIVGFTSTTYTLKVGRQMTTYDEKGKYISTQHV